MIEELRNRHILFDTNVVSGAFYHPEEFRIFFSDLEKLSCHICISDLIAIEFVKIAKGETSRQEIIKFIDSQFICLPIDRSILSLAKSLYPLYNFCPSIRNPKQVSTVDALNATLLQKFSGKLFLVTLDNHDYPLEIMERKITGTIDIKTEILTWGIYGFDNKGFQSLKTIYDKK